MSLAGDGDLGDALRQMIAVLQGERQALAALDIDGITGCANDKTALLCRLDRAGVGVVDDECRGLLDAARRLNEVNRQVRNLVAANVAARLEAIIGSPSLYYAPGHSPRYRAPAYACVFDPARD